MSETKKVRIGFQGARELELDVEDSASAADTVEDAVGAGDGMVWLTDCRGHRFGLVIEKLAFIEIEGDIGRQGIGFGVSD